MNEQTWLECEEIDWMRSRLSATLRATGVIGSDKKKETIIRRQRLFAVGCCRRFVELLNPQDMRAIQLVEEYADTGTKPLLEEADRIVHARMKLSEKKRTAEEYLQMFLDSDIQSAFRDLLARRAVESMNACFFTRRVAVIRAFAATSYGCQTWDEAALAIDGFRPWDSGFQPWDSQSSPEAAVQCELLRDIFGNPFRPVAFDPAWRTEHTVGLAAMMYEDRDFAAMPILADALEEAGCDNPDILTHCREPGVHVRGCWVVDLVLGKG